MRSGGKSNDRARPLLVHLVEHPVGPRNELPEHLSCNGDLATITLDEREIASDFDFGWFFRKITTVHTPRLLPPSRVVQHCLKLTQVNRPFVAILVRSNTRICPCGSREGRNNIRPDAAPYSLRSHPRSAGCDLPRTGRTQNFRKSDPPAKWRGERPSKADGSVQEMFAQHLGTGL